jgi:hypothetical protein
MITVFFLLASFGVLVPALPMTQALVVLGYTVLRSLATDFLKTYSFNRFLA